MADAVTSQTIVNTEKRVVMKFTNLSDGSGEASVAKVDVSALTANSHTAAECARVHITQVWYAISAQYTASARTIYCNITNTTDATTQGAFSFVFEYIQFS